MYKWINDKWLYGGNQCRFIFGVVMYALTVIALASIILFIEAIQ